MLYVYAHFGHVSVLVNFNVMQMAFDRAAELSLSTGRTDWLEQGRCLWKGQIPGGPRSSTSTMRSMRLLAQVK